VGGTPELIEDGESGCLFPTGGLEQAVMLLSGLVVDGALRHRLGSRAQERVTSVFSTDRMLARIEALYRSILATD
jgi:glycosyltransferase involved in cell wall biosynthesis